VTVWGLWYDGDVPSCYPYDPDYEHAQRFESKESAREELKGRHKRGTRLLLFKDNPDFAEYWDPLPDWILTYGPRGGVVREVC
jgi:hypothetical protein